MIHVADVFTLKREQTQWRKEIKKLQRQRQLIDGKISDAQKEYTNIGWAIQQIQLAKKSYKVVHNKKYFATRSVDD